MTVTSNKTMAMEDRSGWMKEIILEVESRGCGRHDLEVLERGGSWVTFGMKCLCIDYIR